MINDIFERIGYTEIFYPVDLETLKNIKKEFNKNGYNVKFYKQKVSNYNFFDGNYIEKEVIYIVGNSEKYFDKLKENNPMEEICELN